MSKKPEPERITLTFDLFDLPTAQHRAGLAGLILQIDAMGPDGYRKNKTLIPEIDEDAFTSTSATITFTRESMQGVFDELYAAKHVEVVVASKWPGKVSPKPGQFHVTKKDPKTGEMKQAPGFAYDVVQPQAPCLMRHMEGKGEPWLDLWRQMLWSILRGGNNVRSRAPFIDRANDEPCGDGATAWTQLVAFQEKKAKSQLLTAPISGALMIGAQAVNAEAVPFAGRVDHNLLLHFWQLVVLTFVPQVVNRKDKKVERIGYVLAIPDVDDLREFRRAFPEVLGNLNAKDARHTPPEARLDLPDQAGLEVLWRLKEPPRQPDDADPGQPLPPAKPTSTREDRFAPRRDRSDLSGRRETFRALAAGKTEGKWGDCVRAVESFHMLKLGNNVKMLSFARVADRPGLVSDYERIKTHYRSPLFRAALMRALIRGGRWYEGMIELFAEYPAPFFIEGDETPKFLPRFGRDASERFRAYHKDLKDMKSEEMDDDDRLKHLSLIVQRLINKYVEGRAEAKTGKKVKDFPKIKVKDRDRPVFPKEFREAQQRVCSDAFLAMRSRHDQDFVEFFAGSICSVAQFLPPGDYHLLTHILMTRPDPSPVGRKVLCWEDIKALAMIAVSSCSFNVRPRDTEPQGSQS